MTEIIDFKKALELSEGGKRHLMLGNGFSRACRNDLFAYDALFQQAEGELSDRVKQAFKILNTHDFETIMRILNSSADVLPVYTDDAALIALLKEDVDALRDALAKAIAGSHPGRPGDIEPIEFAACRSFLSHFEKIYTLNYDLLLYWALMQDEVDLLAINCDDGFRQPVDGPEEYVVWDVADNPIEMMVDSEGDLLHQEIVGIIYGSTLEGASQTEIGKIEFLKIDLGRALENEESLYMFLDGIATETAELGDILIDPKTNDIRDRIHNKEIAPPSILIFIQNLQIYPAFRGNGIGLLALHSITRTYCGLFTAFVLKAFPLQFEEVHAEKYKNLALENFTVDKVIAKKHLSSYYQKLGFWQIDDTDLYYLSSEYAHPLPKELEQYKC